MYSFPHLWNQTLLISQQPESFSCNKRIHLSRWARTYKNSKKKDHSKYLIVKVLKLSDF